MLLPYEGYFVFYCTPTFNLQHLIDHVGEHLVQSVNSLFVDDELVITQDELEIITKNLDMSMKGGQTIKDSLNEAVEQVNI